MTPPKPEDVLLPELRPELELLPGAADADGQPSWLIHDPVLNRFTQLEPAAYEAIKHWRRCRTVGDLIALANAEGRVWLDSRALTSLIDFLHISELTLQPRAGGWQSFAKADAARQRSPAAWLVHNYLFFRIPLIKPQRLLERTLPVARLLWSRPARLMAAATGLAGLYLASRQWELFWSTLLSYWDWEGAVWGVLALILVKTAHELGHAYTAVAFGSRVHTMGIAFVVLAPMPYTDVTDAWRLVDRRKRLTIDSAGMMVEAVIAALMLFLWAFLPDGPLRSAVFVLSAVSIASSLMINLNPFMRFDGYYLLSELIGVENLQARAFALGRWQLREILFAAGLPCPEQMPRRRILALVVYAWSVWVYRLFLFVGIALIVYHYFFKLLGIVLFAIEILFFIARPVSRELHSWWHMKTMLLATRRSRLTLTCVLATTIAVLVPWSTTVEIPAIVEAAEMQMLYPVRNARVAAVHVKHGDRIRAGDPIVSLVSREIEDELAKVRLSLKISLLQFGRRLSDAADRESSLVLESSIAAIRGRIAGLEREQRELKLVAPFDGRIADLNPELHPDRWVSPRDQIAVVAGGDVIAKGYVAEADVGRLTLGASGKFIPEHPSRSSFAIRIERIATGGATQIEIPDLASVNTGRIGVNLDEKRRLIPATAQYLVTLSAIGNAFENDLSVRGVVLAQGRAESLMYRGWRKALGILVRESGA